MRNSGICVNFSQILHSSCYADNIICIENVAYMFFLNAAGANNRCYPQIVILLYFYSFYFIFMM